MSRSAENGLCWSAFFTRLLLGTFFLMPGWYKVFELTPTEHARIMLVEGYSDSWIPTPILWTLGTAIPFLELIGGLLLIVGYQVRLVLYSLGALLLVVSYGHLLKEPFFDVTTHIMPRAILLIVLLAIPRDQDRWSMDILLRRRTTE